MSKTRQTNRCLRISLRFAATILNAVLSWLVNLLTGKIIFSVIIGIIACAMAYALIDFYLDKISSIENTSPYLDRRLRTQAIRTIESKISQRLRDSLYWSGSFRDDPEPINLTLLEDLGKVGRYPKHGQPGEPFVMSQLVDFLEGSYGNRMLILGDPGAGKTTTLLTLSKKLIDRAKTDENSPIPVIIEATNYRPNLPQRTENFIQKIFYGSASIVTPRRGKELEENGGEVFKKWLIDQIGYEVGASRKLDQIEEGLESGQQFIPLIDGLDEIDPAIQTALIKAINQCLQENASMPLVVCCRSRSYDQENFIGSLNGAVFIQPMNDAQIKAYLNKIDPDLWNKIQNSPDLKALLESTLSSGSAIFSDFSGQNYRNRAAFLRIPLFLELIASISTKKEALPDNQEKLIEEYVDQKLNVKFRQRLILGRKKELTREEARRYLAKLAKNLGANYEIDFSLEQISPTWLERPVQVHLYRYTASILSVITLFFLLIGRSLPAKTNTISLALILIIFSIIAYWLGKASDPQSKSECSEFFDQKIIFFKRSNFSRLLSLTIQDFKDLAKVTLLFVSILIILSLVFLGFLWIFTYGSQDRIALLVMVILGLWLSGFLLMLSSMSFMNSMDEVIVFGLRIRLLTIQLLGIMLFVIPPLLFFSLLITIGFLNSSGMELADITQRYLAFVFRPRNWLAILALTSWSYFFLCVLGLLDGTYERYQRRRYRFRRTRPNSIDRQWENNEIQNPEGIEMKQCWFIYESIWSFFLISLLFSMLVVVVFMVFLLGFNISEVYLQHHEIGYREIWLVFWGLGLRVGCTIGFFLALFPIIKYISLYFTLSIFNLIPFGYVKFLNHAVTQRLLQNINGRYSFIHHLFLEYFENVDNLEETS
jgi:hypothetical protein